MALIHQVEAKPKALVALLSYVADQSPTLREIAACCAERTIVLGVDSLAGADRVALLEALLAWRSAAHRGIECPQARSRLSEMAARRTATRTASLAQQLIGLSPRNPNNPSSETVCIAHDLLAMSHRSFRDIP